MRRIGILFLIGTIFLISCSRKSSKGVDIEQNTPEELLQYADNVYNNGDYESAFLAYGLIYEQYPTSREYVDAAVGLSRCYAQFEDYEKGFDIIYNLLKENMVPSKVPKIYNVIAEFYERSAGISAQLTGEGTTDYKTAIEYFRKAIDYPNSEDKQAKSYAQYKVGTLFERLNDLEQALKSYQKTTEEYPDQQWAALAQEKTGIVQSKMQRLKAYETPVSVKKDTVTAAPEKEELKKAATADTTQTVQKPDTTIAPKPPEPAPVPVDTAAVDTTINEKPKLDLN